MIVYDKSGLGPRFLAHKRGLVGVAPYVPGFLGLFVSSQILILMKGREGLGQELGQEDFRVHGWDMA